MPISHPQPSYNTPIPNVYSNSYSADSLRYTNSIYINNNPPPQIYQGNYGGYPLPNPTAVNIFGQPYSSPYNNQSEISYDPSDAASITDSIYTETTAESHCFNCTNLIVDKDLDGYPSEYCSDQCRKEASEAGFANPVCILCKEFPQVNGSKFCGKKRCRNLPKCYFCKVSKMINNQFFFFEFNIYNIYTLILTNRLKMFIKDLYGVR